jgi:hypothetical protein
VTAVRSESIPSDVCEKSKGNEDDDINGHVERNYRDGPESTVLLGIKPPCLLFPVCVILLKTHLNLRGLVLVHITLSSISIHQP